MIQIESVAIRELRGIRELEVTPNRKNFLVSGPNGSGKSGVVDAIQFAIAAKMLIYASCLAAHCLSRFDRRRARYDPTNAAKKAIAIEATHLTISSSIHLQSTGAAV